jgi:hypothetical protein
MSDERIPEQMQIDAALTGRYGDLVRQCCGGAWALLPDKWSVTFDQIADEAKRRGLPSFLAARPTSEGFWLLETEGGYVVFYLERGVRMYHEESKELEPAFLHWLDQELRSHLLPGRPAD